jgi:plastocyanin
MKLSLSRPRAPYLVAAAFVLVLAGCGGGSNDNSGAAPPPATGAQPAPSQPAPSGSAAAGGAASAAGAVNIHNFAFTPAAITVTSGGAVTWTFQDSLQHTVVADDNSFSSKPEGNGQTFAHTFPAAGSVPYHCSIHPFMKGTVTVQ